jgi:hypothetical protein
MFRALALLLSFFAVSVACADEHPVFYIDRGACPFECCKYGEWRSETATRLYAVPKTGGAVVGVTEKGVMVKAETGEVHTKPGKFLVIRDTANFGKGEILWIYTYLGEGYFKIWYRGKLIEEEIGIDHDNPSPEDWGRFEVVPDSNWWVKIRTPNGVQGWTNQPENFSNKDACE